MTCHTQPLGAESYSYTLYKVADPGSAATTDKTPSTGKIVITSTLAGVNDFSIDVASGLHYVKVTANSPNGDTDSAVSDMVAAGRQGRGTLVK